MTAHRPYMVGIATLCVAASLPACEMSDCIPTKTDASDAALVDAGDVANSAVLEARLTTGGKALPGKTLLFDLERRVGPDEFVGSAETGSDGVARVDLKEDLVDFADETVAESYRAAFDGDAKYCGSRDKAEVEVVRGP